MLASPMPPRPTRRNARLRPLAELAGRLTARNLRRRGFTQTALVTGWGDIVGPRLASISLPERLVFPGDATDGATLHIRVDGPIALELQHLAPIVLERVNAHFGYAAVARLKLHQGAMSRPVQTPSPPPSPPLDPAAASRLAGLIADVENPGLKASLKALGEAVLAERPDKRN